jgi:Leucine-rich repeat (LRR) protein
VDFLAKRSGLLLPRGQDQFAFLHLSFQEFFAACFIEDQLVSPDWRDGGATGIAVGAARADVTGYAGKLLWCETLLFLFEMLHTDSPKWVSTARDSLFGRDNARLNPQDTEAKGRAVLLARLTIDPYAGFAGPKHEQAIHACCRWEMAAQKRDEGILWSHKNTVVKTLLMADNAERLAVTKCLAGAAREFGVTRLRLDATGVSDLMALAELGQLRVLHLEGTGVTTVAPLAGLGKLQELFLFGTGVSDVAPLAGLGQLQTLNLSRTGVTDVEPLSGLGQLQWLGLSGTGVNDVGPLSGLKQLRELYLGGTRVSCVGPLAGLEQLQALDLRSTGVSDLTPLEGLKTLSHIELSKGQKVKIPKKLERFIRWDNPGGNQIGFGGG